MIVVLIATIVVLSLVIKSLKKSNEKTVAQAQAAINSANAECDNHIKMIQQDCAAQIRHVKEDIEKRKEILSQRKEKELLIDVMIALDGYGSRFERIEKYLTNDQISEKISQLMQQVTSQTNNVTGTLTAQIGYYE